MWTAAQHDDMESRGRHFPLSALPVAASGRLPVTLSRHLGKTDTLHNSVMTTPANMATLTQVGGQDLKRFVVQSALLSLIDPVRGEPTRTLLDENPDMDVSGGGLQLKQKFLDSFALICSTSRMGAETASAVCLEQNNPDGAILRVARNRGLTPTDLANLEKVTQILELVAKGSKYFIRIPWRLLLM